MKKLQGLCAALLCAAVAAGTLASCSRDGNAPDGSSANAETVEKTEILTNVFRGTNIELPEEYSINTGIKPYYDTENGRMKVLCTHWYMSEEVNEEGVNEYVYDTLLMTVDSNGAVVNEEKLTLPDHTYMNNALVTEDSLIFVGNRYDPSSGNSYTIYVYSFDDGTITSSGELNSMSDSAEGGWFYVNGIATDNEGYIYIAAEQEIIVMNESLVKQFSVPTQSWISDIDTTSDGTVYVMCYFDTGFGLAPVDKNTRSFGETISVPAGLNADQVVFGDGYDMFLSTEEGLYGYDLPDDENAETEPVMVFSYANSDIYGNGSEIARLVDKDCVIMYEQDSETYDSYPVIYRRSADIDLSQIKVLEIAYAEADWDLASKIISFNKHNDGVRIVARDYSIYNTGEDYNAGEKKLINDLLNGIYKPDLVTANSTSSDLVGQIYDRKLYADLYPLMEADGDVGRDDILGCVKRSFETEDGQLWTIGRSVGAYTLIGTEKMLGERNGWTLSELLDFAESLPEGTQLLYSMNRDTVFSLLGDDGYGMFVDMKNNTCDFEQEAFIRYLNYAATLPEAVRGDSLTEVGYESFSERYLLYHNGQIALKDMYIGGVSNWVSLDSCFNTPDYTIVGYPTADGSCGTSLYMQPYIVTSFCEYPDEAWDFLKSLIIPDEDDYRYSGMRGVPVVKEVFMKACEAEYGSLFEIYFDGSGMSWGPYDPEYDDLESEMSEPGIRCFFTKEDAGEMLRWFDEEIGAPVMNTVDDEITAIVNEEVTGYLGGARSAEDCARIIQSRVSIWLSAHE